MEDPDWGPDISYLNINNIATYVKPVDNEVRSWEDVPEDWVCPVCGLGKDAFEEA